MALAEQSAALQATVDSYKSAGMLANQSNHRTCHLRIKSIFANVITSKYESFGPERRSLQLYAGYCTEVARSTDSVTASYPSRRLDASGPCADGSLVVEADYRLYTWLAHVNEVQI